MGYSSKKNEKVLIFLKKIAHRAFAHMRYFYFQSAPLVLETRIIKIRESSKDPPEAV